uniref:Uncharacterized protein n=1 Tax=Panagrolaimus sp. JU765 TaxID=591449 RepID=A0AC34RTN0_9BILA
MLSKIYDYWISFIGRWTTSVDFSHTIEEATGEVFVEKKPTPTTTPVGTPTWKNLEHMKDLPENLDPLPVTLGSDANNNVVAKMNPIGPESDVQTARDPDLLKDSDEKTAREPEDKFDIHLNGSSI